MYSMHTNFKRLNCCDACSVKLRIKTDAKQFDESKPDQNKEQIDDAMEDSQEVEPETQEQEPVAPHSQVHTNFKKTHVIII